MNTDVLIPLIRDNIHQFPNNCYHLFGSVYFVKTAAGLKQSVFHYGRCHDAISRKHTFTEILEFLRFQETPDFRNMKFPLIIEFIPMYFGYHYTETVVKSLY